MGAKMASLLFLDGVALLALSDPHAVERFDAECQNYCLQI